MFQGIEKAELMSRKRRNRILPYFLENFVKNKYLKKLKPNLEDKKFALYKENSPLRI
jgi:hypothetical protein